ncbi:AglZ/HisF2 family acetamidino modification protein [Bdellovibrio sp. 22V]|uniref:AglZ/HisF2 family acetamidino modification protein n=1 Tax=Bdellovibrio TaxID=958 RepID=UPI002542FBA4|nr:AglZ/HisF2 family acetamidino modification protein [Bdellovibrio sp. 22V]WII71819.1 AglZ/HisF2 family acetamidino modification protein [Bdellovibrio sp. 22V]
MLRPRVIPCLLIQDGGLVKTVRFKDPKYVGDPINAVKIFNEKEADELVVLDIDATAKGLEPNYKQIAFLAAECRMPLCYGGGITTAAQAKKIISLGVEKVAISAAAIENPDLITQIADEIGKQSVVVVLDVKQRLLGKTYDVWTHNGTKNTKKNALEFAIEAEKKGAGEIVINSIEDDGRMKGYDVELAQKLRQSVKIPITVMGGAGSLADMGKVISACGVVGVAAGSLFVFKGPYRAVLINYPSSQQKDDLIRSSLSK